MAVTTQTGGARRVTKSFAQHDMFRGIIRLDDEHIHQYTPFVNGYGVFYWVKGPNFMTAADEAMWMRYKHYTEKGSTSFEGIQDAQIETAGMMGGIAGNEFQVATNAKEDFNNFTIKVHELQGSMIREIMDYWLTGIRDPKSGYAHYHGQARTMEYHMRNHTAELIYIQTDPTGLAKGLEYAAYVTNIIPTKVPKAHLNLNHGDHSISQFDLEFTGIKYESRRINQVARNILAAAENIFNLNHYEVNLNQGRVQNGAAVNSNSSNV